MDYHKSLYKSKGYNVGEGARARRTEVITKSRMDKRMTLLEAKRNMAEITTQVSAAIPPAQKLNPRAEMLAKWKAEKMKAMMELKKKQKPIFKVGILQRKATGSPLLKMTNTHADKNFLNPQQLSKVKAIKPPQKGILTRSKAKAMQSEFEENIKNATKFEKIVNDKRKQIKNHMFKVPKSVSELASKLKVTIPQSPQVLKHGKKSKKGKNDIIGVSKIVQEAEMSTIEEDKENIQNCVENDEGKDKKENTAESVQQKTETESEFVPIYYSPYVNKSRGSEVKSPRRVKIKLQMDVEDLIEKEENEFKCRIFSFRKYIECQTKRLLDTCNIWKNLTKVDAGIPEEVGDEVLSLCGKTTLLTSDKFTQFQDLIDKCEKKDPMIKIEDLQGYQDWVAIEVEGLDQAFLKLEERKARNWKADEKQPVRSHVRKETKPAPVKKVGKPQGVRSNIREHILAARKLKQNAAEPSSLQDLDTWKEAKSPIKTPRKSSILRKEVLTSEAKKMNGSARKRSSENVSGFNESKKRFSGMEIMAATRIAKSITPGKTLLKNIINEQTPRFRDGQTPLKSILKQTPAALNASKHSVQFRLSRNRISSVQAIDEEYLQPLMDEEYASFLSMKISDFTLSTPKSAKKKQITSTPIRRSARLAMK